MTCYRRPGQNVESVAADQGSRWGAVRPLALGFTGRLCTYNIAKEAIRALTRSAAREWGVDNITVNNLLPVADTWGDAYDAPAPTNVLGRYGSPEDDIAPVVLFLASQDAQFITGYSLTPDGGQIIDSAR